MFESRNAMLLRERQYEIEMEEFVGRLLENTQLNIDEIYELFIEAYPTEGHRFEEIVQDWVA